MRSPSLILGIGIALHGAETDSLVVGASSADSTAAVALIQTDALVVGAVSADSATGIALVQTDALVAGAVSADSTVAATLVQTAAVLVAASSADSTASASLVQTDPSVVAASSANSTTAITLTDTASGLAYRTHAASGGSGVASTRTATITPAVGDLLVVFCAVVGNTEDAPECTDDNGGTYASFTSAKFGAANIHRISGFVRDSLMSNTTSTTVTVNTGTSAGGGVSVVAISGAQSGHAGAWFDDYCKTEGGAASGTPAVTFDSSVPTGNLTLAFVGNATNPAGLTPPSSWTERVDAGAASTPNFGMELATRDSGFTGTTITWGSTSASVFAALGFSIKA